jgi:hypothetical protein
MQIRLYLDEDAMDSDLVHALRMHGVEVTTALDESLIEHYDKDHLAFAASQSRACIPSTLVIISHCTAHISRKADIMPASFLPRSNATALASRCAVCSGSSTSDQPKPYKIKLSF